MKPRPIFILSILTLLLSCSKTFIQKNDLEKRGLNGQVKQIKSEVYELIPKKDSFQVGNKINSTSFDRDEILEFDKKGNLTSEKEFLIDGKPNKISEYTYNQKDQLKKLIVIDNYGKGSKQTYEYFYNENDSLIKVIFKNDGFERIMKFDRSKRNNVKEIEFINDTIAWINTIQFDQNKNVVKEIECYNKKDTFRINKKIYKERVLQKQITKKFGKWDTLENIVNYKYFKNKYPNEINASPKNTTVQIILKNDKKIEERWIPPNSQYSVTTVQKFNSNGDLIQHLRINKNDTLDIWKYEYKFDSKDNWIRKFSFKNDKPLTVVDREIIYY